jgi:hypothetical protein
VKRALHALIDATPIEAFFADEDSNRPPRPAASFNFDRRLAAASILTSALRRRIDLEPGGPDEIKLRIGTGEIRLTALARRALHSVTGHDRITFASLAAELGRDTNDRELIDSLCGLARMALIEIVE